MTKPVFVRGRRSLGACP